MKLHEPTAMRAVVPHRAGVLLERGPYAATAELRIDPERLDVAFCQRFAVVYHRGPARLGAEHLDQEAQETDAPGAVISAEHMRFQRVREMPGQVAVLGQHPPSPLPAARAWRRPHPSGHHAC